MQEIVLVQSAIAHLAIALRLLDQLDADVTAAHVDAALQALREEPAVRRSFQQFLEDRSKQFADMDEMIDQMFAIFTFSEPDSLPAR